MQRILILGAGGHAQVVADILMRARDAGERIRPIGYLDDNSDSQGQALLGLPILGSIADLTHIAHDALIVAIGDNRTRQSLFDQLYQSERFVIARHPTAVIAPDVSIGPGAAICAGVVVNPGSVIGADVILNTGCTVDHDNRIDDHAHVAPGVHLGGEVQIGEGTLVGIGATVMPRRRIGAWSIAGAGAVVHVDISDHVVVAGVPASVVRHIDTRRQTDHAHSHVFPRPDRC
jgi:sugar O-acyltransferase (sialic acid O-acetyltransferase NeuD family)